MNWSGQPTRTTGVLMFGVVEVFDDGAAEAVVQNVVFHRADDIDAAREKFDRAGVERLDPARVDDGGGDALRFECLRRLSAISHMPPRPKIATCVPCLTTSALPISRIFGCVLRLRAGARAARVADGDGAVV
jgi:hypothetical protein